MGEACEEAEGRIGGAERDLDEIEVGERSIGLSVHTAPKALQRAVGDEGPQPPVGDPPVACGGVVELPTSVHPQTS